jgi:hypothetical protein
MSLNTEKELEHQGAKINAEVHFDKPLEIAMPITLALPPPSKRCYIKIH